MNERLLYVLGRGRQKKGRMGQREGKKIKLSSDLDPDDDDNPN